MLFYLDFECLVNILILPNNNASLCTMELNINDESGCKRQNRSFFPTNILAKHYIRRYKQQGENKKNWKTVRLKSFQKPTIPIRVHPCLLSLYYQYLLWMFWSIIFMFHSIWVAVPSVKILIKYVLRVPTWTFKKKSNRPRSSCKQNTCPLEKIYFPACYNSTWWRRQEDNILEHWGMNTFISPLSFGALRHHNHVENLSP